MGKRNLEFRDRLKEIPRNGIAPGALAGPDQGLRSIHAVDALAHVGGCHRSVLLVPISLACTVLPPATRVVSKDPDRAIARNKIARAHGPVCKRGNERGQFGEDKRFWQALDNAVEEAVVAREIEFALVYHALPSPNHDEDPDPRATSVTDSACSMTEERPEIQLHSVVA
jgi:hypothetical protein